MPDQLENLQPSASTVLTCCPTRNCKLTRHFGASHAFIRSLFRIAEQDWVRAGFEEAAGRVSSRRASSFCATMAVASGAGLDWAEHMD